MKVCVVGGSIGGLSAALALLQADCEVVVLERASAVVPAGAGLGLDAITTRVLDEAGLGAGFQAISSPVPFEEHRLVNHQEPAESRRAVPIVVHEEPGMTSAHWSDLHRLLAEALPPGTVRFSHKAVGLRQDGEGVTIAAEARLPDDSCQPLEVHADFVIAADGANSTLRRLLVPDDARRYTGMVAWRGVLKGREQPELLAQLQREYPHLGRGVTFDLSTCAGGGFTVVYAIGSDSQLINWLWYQAEAERELPSHSVTRQPLQADIDELHSRADALFIPTFASLVKATREPFINVLHDKDPLDRWVFGRVALLGEAAHPATPHGGRATNMSIQDAFCLGRCLRQHGPARFLQAWQAERLAQTAREVLFSRHVGQLRQGWWVDHGSFNWPAQSLEVRRLLLNVQRLDPDYRATATRLLHAAGAQLLPAAVT